MPPDAYSAIEGFVDARHRDQVDMLRRLVQVPTDNPPGDCAPHAEMAAGLLERLGLTVERHPVPDELVRRNGMISATNLIVRHRFGPGPVIALNAHGDVVPPGQGWTKDPYAGDVEGGRMYGRGVAVSKSDFATYAYALLALKALGQDLGGAVELHLTYDEEAGGAIGPGWLLSEGLTRPDYALSAGFSYGVVTAHNGCLHMEIRVRGRIAHAALPATGHDALEAATGVLDALYAYRKELGAKRSGIVGIESPTLVVGLIKGGVNTNVVPDLVSLRLDRRLIPEEEGATVEREVRAVIAAAVAGRDGISCEVERIMLAQPLTPLPGSEGLSDALARHGARLFGEPIRVHGVPLYTDARHYAAAGVPTVLYGAGPRTILEAGAHGGDENLCLEDLRRATCVVASAVYDLLGGHT
ncbi:MAG TPA: M20/M25/M40 family metallo-hydrolase [Alphaproteobacteria bacterium]|nr:M20/M25/M40 family metallo-hydrolase [Alphaproteobacteria bacterium]